MRLFPKIILTWSIIVTCLFTFSPGAMAACSGTTSGTATTLSTIISTYFVNGRAAGSISPDCIRDLAQSTYGNASNSIDLKNLGLPTGGDDTAAINSALVSAKAAGVAVYAPAATYKHAGTITIDSVRLFGDGEGTVFNASDATGVKTAMSLRGVGAVLDNVKLTTVYTGGRLSNGESAAVVVEADFTSTSISNFTIQRVHIAGTVTNKFASAGVLIVGGGGSSSFTTFDGKILNNKLDYTLADAYHVCCGAHDIIVSDNQANNAGDDCYPVVSYTGNLPTYNVTISHNQCTVSGARGLVVEGGKSVTYTGNIITGPLGGGAYCMLVGGDSGQIGVDGVVFSNNICKDTASTNNEAVVFSGVTGMHVKNVSFTNNLFLNSHVGCINITGFTSGVKTSNVNFSHNICEGDSTASVTGLSCFNSGGTGGTLNGLILDHNIFNNYAGGIGTCSGTGISGVDTTGNISNSN